MSQKWYQSSKGKVKVVWVALPGRGRWSGTLQIGIRAKVQALSLDGPDKWSLEPRFQREIVPRGYLGHVTKLRGFSGM
jgi:hypothetical protein